MGWDKHTNISDAAKWLKRKIELIENKDVLIQNKLKRGTTYIIQAKRGGIFDCELGYGNIGGEKNKTRPVLILSNNSLNNGHTVVVVPLSTKFARLQNGMPKYKNHYLLKKSQYGFLDKDSAVKFEDIRNVDVARLRQFRGNVNVVDMKRMQKNIKFTFGY